MRPVLSVLVAVTSVLTVPSSADADPATARSAAQHTAAVDAAYVERVLYATSLNGFVWTAATGDRWYDWSSDLCSAPLVGSTGRSFDFRVPCRRHDFGYRNLRLLERRYGTGTTYWNSTTRHRVDQQFLADMQGHCRARPWYEEATCLLWAETFYTVVRVGGGP